METKSRVALNILLSAFITGMFATGPAVAEPQNAPINVFKARVQLTDLDLNTTAGAQTLAIRLKNAASKVCGADLPVARAGADFIPCRRAAIERAVSGLNAPLVMQALRLAPRSPDLANR